MDMVMQTYRSTGDSGVPENPRNASKATLRLVGESSTTGRS